MRFMSPAPLSGLFGVMRPPRARLSRRCFAILPSTLPPRLWPSISRLTIASVRLPSGTLATSPPAAFFFIIVCLARLIAQLLVRAAIYFTGLNHLEDGGIGPRGDCHAEKEMRRIDRGVFGRRHSIHARYRNRLRRIIAGRLDR